MADTTLKRWMHHGWREEMWQVGFLGYWSQSNRLLKAWLSWLTECYVLSVKAMCMQASSVQMDITGAWCIYHFNPFKTSPETSQARVYGNRVLYRNQSVFKGLILLLIPWRPYQVINPLKTSPETSRARIYGKCVLYPNQTLF